MVTGVPVPTLNNVFTARAGASRSEVETLLRLVAKSGLPHALQLRPGTDSRVKALSLARGMRAHPPIPLMAVEVSTKGILEAPQAMLNIRLAGPDEAALHASLLAAGFDVPQQLFDQLITTAVLALPGVRCYVGAVEGEPVATALGFSNGEHVGIYNVATHPKHRGLGYGAAITASAVLDGFAAGVSFAYLQSSDAGYRVYQQLGFTQLESWAVWIASA